VRSRATSRSYDARWLTGPLARNPSTHAGKRDEVGKRTDLRVGPRGSIAIIETAIATAPHAHHPRGQTKSAPAVSRKRSVARSHTTPMTDRRDRPYQLRQFRELERLRNAKQVSEPVHDEHDGKRHSHGPSSATGHGRFPGLLSQARRSASVLRRDRGTATESGVSK
jgi:hypothetical protein